MESKLFYKIFEVSENQNKVKDKQNFWSRLFGLFYEEIVPLWCTLEGKEKYKPYNLCTQVKIGDRDYKKFRPSIYKSGRNKKHLYKGTMDFLFVKETQGKKELFIVEQKTWIAYNNFKFIELNRGICKSIKDELSTLLKNFCKNPRKYIVKYEGKKEEIEVKRAILIWPRVNEDDLKYCKKILNFADILSFEEMILDLIRSNKGKSELWKLMSKYKELCDSFFNNFFYVINHGKNNE